MNGSPTQKKGGSSAGATGGRASVQEVRAVSTDAGKERIERFAIDKGLHKLDVLRAQGVYDVVARFNSIVLGRRERGQMSLHEMAGLTNGQLDKALKLLSDAGIVNLETHYGRVVVSIREEAPCTQDQT
jgi:hypothetical protein